MYDLITFQISMNALQKNITVMVKKLHVKIYQEAGGVPAKMATKE